MSNLLLSINSIKLIFTWYFRAASSNDKICCNEENKRRASLSTRKKKLSTRSGRNFSLEFTFFDSVKLPKTRSPWKKRESAAAGWLSNFFLKTHVPQSKTLLNSKPMSVVSCVSNAKTSFAQEPRKKKHSVTRILSLIFSLSKLARDKRKRVDPL